MSKIYIIGFIIILVIAIIISNVGKASIQYNKISFEEMYNMIAENKNFIILDVRTINEYNEGHIPGSVLIPDYEIEAVQTRYKNKDTNIFVYCRSGNRSKSSVIKLKNMGYKNVYDLGGITNYSGQLEK